MSFKARKKLMAGKRKCKRVGRSKTDDCGGVVCVCQKQSTLDLLVERSISGEMSCGKNDQQT